MKLKVHEFGEGDRVAVLIHGIMASAGTWHRVVPLLVARGYRVLAPDLRGHGESPHADDYRAESFAGDLVDSLPTGVDVAIGHSLGALSLSLAVADLRPAKAVYSDPAWKLVRESDPLDLAAMGPQAKASTRAQIKAMGPRWSEEDVTAELASLAVWDVRTTELPIADRIPDTPVVPSLVQLADPCELVPPELADRLRSSGFEVRVVKDTGHCIHRDDLAGFMSSLEGWI